MFKFFEIVGNKICVWNNVLEDGETFMETSKLFATLYSTLVFATDAHAHYFYFIF
jgi:hypothetical protein